MSLKQPRLQQPKNRTNSIKLHTSTYNINVLHFEIEIVLMPTKILGKLGFFIKMFLDIICRKYA